MHIQIVNFRLKDVTEGQYARLCDEIAPAFAAVPGLLTKVWLAYSHTGTFGGVYTWDSREAMERYTTSDLFKTVATHPNLAGITSSDFAVMEGPTRVTRGQQAAHV